MKRTLILMMIALSLFAIAGCSTATAEQPREYTFTYVHDWSEPKEPQGMVRIMQEMSARATETAQEAAVATEAAPEPDYWEGTDYSGPYDPDLNNNPAYLNYGQGWNSADGFYGQGVRAGVDSQTETYYSSAVAYHCRTGEWHTDDEGYWRDADNRYVVSSDDYPQDAIVQTSKGEGRVYDSGSGEGNIDMYVSW